MLCVISAISATFLAPLIVRGGFIPPVAKDVAELSRAHQAINHSLMSAIRAHCVRHAKFRGCLMVTPLRDTVTGLIYWCQEEKVHFVYSVL